MPKDYVDWIPVSYVAQMRTIVRIYEKAFDTDPKLRYCCSNSFCCFGWKVPVIGACCAEVHKCTILGIEVHDPYGL